MKRLLLSIAVISAIAVTGLMMTACGSQEQKSEGTTAAETTVAKTTAAATTAPQTTAAGQATTAPAESTTVPQTEAAQKNQPSSAAESKAPESSAEASEEKSDSDDSVVFAGISEGDAKVMALLDLVTENATVESCKQGADKNGADCWVIILKDADNDRYISYVNADGSTTLPYTE